ncbi:MAG: vitamin K epoxide reductase family protein [Candidatus Nanoarchaeia archaeon]|nr:vitamin K epoxide reductase family protein [Candidatus Nanoarchaeia archaeon]
MKKESLYNISMFFAIVGFLIGAYLTYTHYAQLSSFCLPGQEASCDIVLKGPYATLFFGIPNALIGAIGFAFMFFAARAGKKGNKKADKILLALSTISILFVLFLAYLIYFVIEAFCAWCFAAWICVLIIFLSAIAINRSKKKR